MSAIQMVDLVTQYERLRNEIDPALAATLRAGRFIGGPEVEAFSAELSAYLGGGQRVVTCANGTDALQIAMMALGLRPGDEVIVPTFTYIATAEVIALLGLTPVMVDVGPDTFTIDIAQAEAAITPRTRAIVPVHLFGQCAEMAPLLALAAKHRIHLIEDNAQAIGADYLWSDGRVAKAGTMGVFGCTSFFPSKNLGCYGDGGALSSADPGMADAARVIASHGQTRQYVHDVIGVNSRLDALQAAILRIKLRHLNDFNHRRIAVADRYDSAFGNHPRLQPPVRAPWSTHVFHQYTLRLLDGDREALRAKLAEKGVPSMVYYPIPLHRQKAFTDARYAEGAFPITEMLCDQVLSLPIHTEMDAAQQDFIIQEVLSALGS